MRIARAQTRRCRSLVWALTASYQNSDKKSLNVTDFVYWGYNNLHHPTPSTLLSAPFTGMSGFMVSASSRYSKRTGKCKYINVISICEEKFYQWHGAQQQLLWFRNNLNSGYFRIKSIYNPELKRSSLAAYMCINQFRIHNRNLELYC